MSKRLAIWGAVFAALFLFVMAWVTKGQLDCVAIAATPVILGSEAIVFAMIYATFYLDAHESAVQHSH